jgi:hypothetical protein
MKHLPPIRPCTEEEQALVVAHMGFIRFMAGAFCDRFQARHLLPDLLQHGAIGAMVAAQRWDRIGSFKRYAQWYVRSYLQVGFFREVRHTSDREGFSEEEVADPRPHADMERGHDAVCLAARAPAELTRRVRIAGSRTARADVNDFLEWIQVGPNAPGSARRQSARRGKSRQALHKRRKRVQAALERWARGLREEADLAQRRD